MDQPEGYQQLSQKHKQRLIKALYGLKQSPREWNVELHKFMISEGFTRSESDACVYFKWTGSNFIFVGVYVDDIISFGTNQSEVQQFREQLHNKFQCSEGGLMDFYLGMEIQQDKTGIKINQKSTVWKNCRSLKNIWNPRQKDQHRLILISKISLLTLKMILRTILPFHIDLLQKA